MHCVQKTRTSFLHDQAKDTAISEALDGKKDELMLEVGSGMVPMKLHPDSMCSAGSEQ